MPASGRRSVRAEVPPTQRQHVLRRGANCHSGSECRWMAPRTRVERAVDIAVDNFVDYLKPWGHGSKQSRTWWVAFRPADSPAH